MHGFGYHLTYNHGVYHGKATALFLGSMVEMHTSKDHKDVKKGYKLLEILGFKTTLELRQFIIDIVGPYTIRYEDFELYTEFESKNKRKLKSHDFEGSWGIPANAWAKESHCPACSPCHFNRVSARFRLWVTTRQKSWALPQTRFVASGSPHIHCSPSGLASSTRGVIEGTVTPLTLKLHPKVFTPMCAT